MANVARVSEVPAQAIHADRGGPGDSGSILMGSAIGFASAIAFGLFLWLAVH
jgi:hypothetical protein